MSIIELTSLILDAILTLATSWPFVILVIVFRFHKEIAENITKIFSLLTRLKSVSAGDKSIIFSEQLAKIEHDNEDPSHQKTNIEIKSEWGFAPQDEFEKLALLRPDFSILDSWKPIENRLSELAQQGQENYNYPPGRNLKYLVDKNQITKNHYSYIREIMQLRNVVVHDGIQSITYEDAYKYRNNCIEIMYMLEFIQTQ